MICNVYCVLLKFAACLELVFVTHVLFVVVVSGCHSMVCWFGCSFP